MATRSPNSDPAQGRLYRARGTAGQDRDTAARERLRGFRPWNASPWRSPPGDECTSCPSQRDNAAAAVGLRMDRPIQGRAGSPPVS